MYPISLKLDGKKCVVIGGGAVAGWKILSLLACGAFVTVISPDCTDEITELAGKGLVKYFCRKYKPADLSGAFLVISATNKEAVNKQVAEACFQKGILVNVVDVPGLCNFFVPSVVRRGDLTITISTGGKSPLLAKQLRQKLEHQFGEEYGPFLDILGKAREQVLARCDDPIKRKKIFQQLVNSDILQLLQNGEENSAKGRVEECISLLLD